MTPADHGFVIRNMHVVQIIFFRNVMTLINHMFMFLAFDVRAVMSIA